jgi:hypothetical protein
VGGIVVALFGASLLNQNTATEPTTTTTVAPAIGVSCIDGEAAAAKTNHASEMLTAAGQAANNGDVASAVSFVRSAASDFHAVAVLTAADPAISSLEESAANHLDASAAALESGQYTLATQEVNAATSSIDQATTAVENTTASAC